MCHVILLMPVFALVLFWLLPFDVALPIYLVILAASGVLYFILMKAMHRPVTTGKEGLLGKSVNVVEVSDREIQVWVEGAIWQAVSDKPLRKGDKARVVGIEGLTLRITQSPTVDELKTTGSLHHHHH
jgi:membrane protein implicated in regulation of membrane protease activity